MDWDNKYCKYCKMQFAVNAGDFRCSDPFTPHYWVEQENQVDLEKQLAKQTETKEAIDHPAHYGGADDPYEAIKVIEAWQLGFSLGNCVKYISRAGKKDADKLVEDLRKAKWYLEREISNLEKQNP